METVQKWWQAEAPRRVLFLPVCFALGIGLFYGLPWEPPRFLLLALVALSISFAILISPRGKWPFTVLTLVLMGAAWANLMTPHSPANILREPLTPRPVVGVVHDIQRTEHGVRLTIDHPQVADLPPEKTPDRIRLSIRLKKDSTLELPQIGDGVGLRAGLMPPMGPALPHGFDFARYFSLRGIGAVGFGLPPWEVLKPDLEPTIANQFRNWRVRITDDIIKTLGATTGGVGAGLITGDAKAITEADFEALRASNLYHIIAISGEHMMVIAGVIFISLRLLALLLPRGMGLRPQVKSIAAFMTLILVTLYLFVTGMPISAVRAYVMIVLVLLAVLFRRQVDPMRSLAIAALLMLIYDPTEILDPGFQLSFAATLALVALIESRLLVPPPAIERGRGRNALRLVVTMLLVSVVAEAATTPFVIAQFNNVSLYGVFANTLATPLVSLFLMPVVALYFILLPFGLHHIALWALNYGIKALLGIAHWIASFPYAQFFAPSIPGYGVGLFALGLLWLCLWQTKSRRLGIIAMIIGVMTITLNDLPDVLVGGGLKQIAFRTNDSYVLARGRSNSMLPELWANGLGYKQLAPAEEPNWRCDKLGCVARVKGKVIAFPTDAVALAEDCKKSSIVITTLINAKCDSPTQVVDGDMLGKNNVTAFWINGSIRRETSTDWQGKRSWSVSEDDEDDARDED